MHGVLLCNLEGRFSALHLNPVPVLPIPLPIPGPETPEEGNNNSPPLNPLLVDEVIHTVFDYLDFRSLKKCRQVCKTWNLLATKKVKLVVFGKYEEQQRESLESLLNSISLPSFINIEVRGSFGLPISTLLHSNGTKIQRFTLNAGKQKVSCRLSNFEDLVLHAKLLISVLEDSQYKYFKFLEVYKKNPLWGTVRKIVSDWESPYFPEYIELCPNLEAIIIPSQKNYLQGMRSIFACDRLDSLASANKLKSIGEINFHLFKNETEYLRKFNAISWNLTKFEITVDSLNPIVLVRTCILQLAPTLETLIIQVASLFDEYHWAVTHYGQDNWLIPTGMKNLKALTVTSVGNKKIITRSLVSMLHLQSLRSLTLKGFVDENAFQNLVGNQMELEVNNLTSLEICCRKEPFMDAGFFLRRVNPWPNVRELKLTRPSIEVILAVFMKLDKIEFLDLLLETSRGRKVIPWNSILGTSPFDRDNQNFISSSDLPDLSAIPRPCLGHLRRLKSLKIGFTLDSTDYDDWKLNDNFIMDVLMNLKELQYFHVTQHKFSDGAIGKLREAMRPYCNINVKASPSNGQVVLV